MPPGTMSGCRSLDHALCRCAGRWAQTGGLALTLAVGLSLASEAQADMIRLGSWNGALETTADLVRQQTQSQGGARTTYNNSALTEQLTLNHAGLSIYSPRLLTMSLGGTFGLTQEWAGLETGQAFRHGTLTGYDMFTSVLGEQATSLNVFAHRNNALFARELAGRSEAVTESRGATLFTRRLPLPSTWSVRQEHEEETSRAGGITASRDDARTVLRYDGSRGWTDRELSLSYEFTDLDARATPSVSYHSHETSAAYDADFGAELNRHLDSQVKYFTRSGGADLSTLTVNETLRIDHSDRLWSDYRYLLLSTTTSGESSAAHTGTVNIHHQLYDALHTTAGGDVLVQTLPGGEKDSLRSQLDVAYTKRLPGRGQLQANVGGQLAYQEDRFTTAETFVPQETHVFATPLALPITLQNPLVVTATVTVTKTILGALPVGCLTPSGPPVPLVLGRDYTLLPIGDAVQIVPVACSAATPGINPGDTIAVDYQVSVFPSLTFLTEGWRLDLSVDYRWIRPYVSHRQTDQTLLSGQEDGLLDTQQSDAIGLELRGETRWLRANAVGEWGRFDSRRLVYDRLRGTQVLTVFVRMDVTMTFSADEAWLTFESPAHETRTLAGRMTLTYAPRPGLLMELSGDHQRLTDTLLTSERRTTASWILRWAFRQLEITPRLELFYWDRGDTSSEEYRAFLQCIRRF